MTAGLSVDKLMTQLEIHIHRGVGQWNVLDGALQKLDVDKPGPGLVCSGKFQHLIGHVHAVGEASLSNPTSRQQHVDPATRTQIQDTLARMQISHGNRVTAAKAGHDGLDGQLILLGGGVKAGAESLINLTTAAATGSDCRVHSAGGTTTLIGLDNG